MTTTGSRSAMGRGPSTVTGGRHLRVTHAVLTLNPGGMERVVLSLARRGRDRGQDVSVLCLEGPGSLAVEARDLGAEVVALGLPGGLRRPGAADSIARALRGLGTEVLHTHQVGALFHAGRPARRAGVGAVVHTEHGDHVARAEGTSAKLRARAVLAWAGRSADRLIAVSPGVAAGLSASGAIPGRKLAVVPNGIDLRPFFDERLDAEAAAIRRSLGIPGLEPVVGTVGRLAEVKRQDRLIRGFAALLDRAPSAHLLIVGDGPLRADLEALARSTGVAGRVHFVGHQQGAARWLRAMDCFCLTSRSEGMPLAILEAWAAGVPVVASRIAGVESLVEHGRTGCLVDPDSPRGLADALHALLADPSRALSIGLAGRWRALGEFDEEAMVAAYEGHYRDVLAGKGAVR